MDYTKPSYLVVFLGLTYLGVHAEDSRSAVKNDELFFRIDTYDVRGTNLNTVEGAILDECILW